MKEASKSSTIKVRSAPRKVSPNILTTSHAAVGGRRRPCLRTPPLAPTSISPKRHPGAPSSIADDSTAGFKAAPVPARPSADRIQPIILRGRWTAIESIDASQLPYRDRTASSVMAMREAIAAYGDRPPQSEENCRQAGMNELLKLRLSR